MSAITERVQAPTRTRTVELHSPAGEDFDDIEATDVIIHRNGREQIDVGGGGALGFLYLRFEAEDLVVQAERAKRLLDRVIDAVLEARDKATAEPHRCYCHALLDGDEDTCGAAACVRMWADDCRGLQ